MRQLQPDFFFTAIIPNCQIDQGGYAQQNNSENELEEKEEEIVKGPRVGAVIDCVAAKLIDVRSLGVKLPPFCAVT